MLIFESDLFYILIGSFILLFVIVGRIIVYRKKKNLPIGAPQIMRYLVLPTFLLYLISLLILELSYQNILIKLTGTILIVFLISFIINFLNHIIFSEKNIINKERIIPKLGRDIIQFILVLLATAVVVSTIWGYDLGNILTALGIGSFILGLALQEPLGNLFQGVSLLMARPFHIGDWIKVDNEEGKVVEMNWRSVKILNRFNEHIVVPNNILGKEKIKNMSRPNKEHAEIAKIGFSYQDDPALVKKILEDLASSINSVIDRPKPKAITISYEDFYISYGLIFFIEDYENVVLIRDEIMTSIYSVSKEQGLSIPFPVREVTLKDPNTQINK